jgi:hypothetical protein
LEEPQRALPFKLCFFLQLFFSSPLTFFSHLIENHVGHAKFHSCSFFIIIEKALFFFMFVSWPFYKISICFQIHHSILICYAIFSSFFNFLVLFLNWFLLSISPCKQKFIFVFHFNFDPHSLDYFFFPFVKLIFCSDLTLQ